LRAEHNVIPEETRMPLAYIAGLNAMAEVGRAEANARREAEACASAQAARERMTPLEDRLGRLLATIPREVQAEGLSLASLQASLRGRWRGNCHPGDLGTALRRLGFTRRRQWRDEAGFQALWYPKRVHR
jgi:hypothetical protein